MPVIIRNIFEDYCKDRFGVKDCVAVNSGSSASNSRTMVNGLTTR